MTGPDPTADLQRYLQAARDAMHRILIHVIAETNRHARYADIVRELIDGAAGLRRDTDNMAPGDAA